MVASRLPDWLGFDYRTVHKIEKKRRDVSFVEVQELAKALETTVAAVDRQSKAIAVARGKTFLPEQLAKRPPKKR